MPLQSCIFCRIITGEIPAQKIRETDDLLVIQDIAPKAPVHYLILPKQHFFDVRELATSEQLPGAMIRMADELAHGLSGSQAFRLIANNGADAGQSVFHVHYHFLSGKKMLDF